MQDVTSKIDWAAIIYAASTSLLGILAISLLTLTLFAILFEHHLSKKEKSAITMAMLLLISPFAGAHNQSLAADEEWTIREGSTARGEWEGTWRVKDYGKQFDCRQTSQTEATVIAKCVMVKTRGWVAIRKFNASDNNECNYIGSGSGGTFTGTYICSIGGKREWNATVRKQSK